MWTATDEDPEALGTSCTDKSVWPASLATETYFDGNKTWIQPPQQPGTVWRRGLFCRVPTSFLFHMPFGYFRHGLCGHCSSYTVWPLQFWAWFTINPHQIPWGINKNARWWAEEMKIEEMKIEERSTVDCSLSQLEFRRFDQCGWGFFFFSLSNILLLGCVSHCCVGIPYVNKLWIIAPYLCCKYKFWRL